MLKAGTAVNVFDDVDVDQSAVAEDAIRLQKQGVHESFLMATGSADHHVYIYDVGDPLARNRYESSLLADRNPVASKRSLISLFMVFIRLLTIESAAMATGLAQQLWHLCSSKCLATQIVST